MFSKNPRNPQNLHPQNLVPLWYLFKGGLIKAILQVRV